MALKVLLLAVLLVLVRSQPNCPPFYERVGNRCLMSCSHPIFANCPDSFPYQFAFQVCAVLSDGSAMTYPFDCTPCANADVVGLTFGECRSDVFPLCRPWEELIDGVCVDKCESLVCDTGEECRRGECRPLNCKSWE